MSNDKRQRIKVHHFLFVLLSLLFVTFFLMSCRPSANLDEPPEIIYGQDVCDECSMIINEERFAASYITKSGDIRRFDDMGGMLLYDQKHQEDVHIYWVHDLDTQAWLNANGAHFVLSDELVTPMGWGVAAFATQERADAFMAENGGVMADFAMLQQEIADGNLDPTTLSTHQHEDELEMEHDMDSGDE